MALPKAAIKRIHGAVDKLFDRLKSVFVGTKLDVDNPKGIDRSVAIRYRHELSLPGVYEYAVKDEGVEPSRDTLEAVKSVAESYIDAQRERTKALVVRDVQRALNEADTAGVDTDVKTVLGGTLAQTFDKVTSEVNRIIDTETQHTRNLGNLEAIEKINAASGVDDPTVFFVIVRDNHICSECLRLHQLHGTIDGPPRVWKLSELGHGYHKKGEESPKVGGLHPHCRCTMATLMPGYGFDASGRVAYIDPEHDEYERQRSMEKSESEPLEKAEWYWNKLRPAFEAFGWRAEEGGAHLLLRHPGIPHARPVPVKRSQMHGAIDPRFVDTFIAKKMGLRVPHKGSEVIIDPTHEYAKDYERLGYHKSSGATTKQWTPAGEHEQVPIDLLDSHPVEPMHQWKEMKWHSALVGGSHSVPAVKTAPKPDGRHAVVEGHEVVAAARRAGMTHVPVSR